jgi:hypothetical protein
MRTRKQKDVIRNLDEELELAAPVCVTITSGDSDAMSVDTAITDDSDEPRKIFICAIVEK